MSLEETIAANTAAIGDLIAVWKGMAQPAVQPTQGQTIAQDIGKAAGVVAAAAVAATGAAPLAEVAGVVAQATITDVLTAASQLVADPAKGKNALKAALTDAGIKVKAISEIPAEKLGDALTAIKLAIAL